MFFRVLLQDLQCWMALFAKLLSHIAQRLHMSDKAKTYLDLHQVYVSRIDGTHSSLLDFVVAWFGLKRV